MKGFSLIELVVVLAIFVVLTGLSVPSYKSYVSNNRAKTYASDIMLILKTARSNALSRKQDVSACAVDTEGPAFSCAATAGSWTKGWAAILESESTVFRGTQLNTAFADVDTGITISPNLKIIYNGSGFSTPSGFTITITPPGCTRGYRLTGSPGGSVKKESIDC